MPDAGFFPIDGGRPVLFEKQSLPSTNLENLRAQSAKSHFVGFLFLFSRRFVQNRTSEIGRKRDPGKFKGVKCEIGAPSQFETLPDHGIEGHVGLDSAKNIHALYELTVRDRNRLTLSDRLRQAKNLDSGILLNVGVISRL